MTHKEFEENILNTSFPMYSAKEDKYVMSKFRNIEDFKYFMQSTDPKRLMEELKMDNTALNETLLKIFQ